MYRADNLEFVNITKIDKKNINHILRLVYKCLGNLLAS